MAGSRTAVCAARSTAGFTTPAANASRPAASYGRQFRGTPADSQMPISKVLREHDRPEIRVERTDYGMRLQTLRKISDAHTHIRVTNILFPQAFVIPMNAEMTISQWHVP